MDNVDQKPKKRSRLPRFLLIVFIILLGAAAYYAWMREQQLNNQIAGLEKDKQQLSDQLDAQRPSAPHPEAVNLSNWPIFRYTFEGESIGYTLKMPAPWMGDESHGGFPAPVDFIRKRKDPKSWGPISWTSTANTAILDSFESSSVYAGQQGIGFRPQEIFLSSGQKAFFTMPASGGLSYYVIIGVHTVRFDLPTDPSGQFSSQEIKEAVQIINTLKVF